MKYNINCVTNYLICYLYLKLSNINLNKFEMNLPTFDNIFLFKLRIELVTIFIDKTNQYRYF